MGKSLSDLEGTEIGQYNLLIGSHSEGRFPEEVNFKLYLKNYDGERSKNPVIYGKYFSGRGELYTPWFEIDFEEKVNFESESVNVLEEDLGENIFRKIVDIMPPGGRIMVSYLNHKETKNGLQRNIPSPATPIGYLLFRSGCVWFKNWYFPEGGWEGSVKLQGEKPVNEESKEKGLQKTRRKLEAFLEREKNRSGEIFKAAKKRAKKILEEIS